PDLRLLLLREVRGEHARVVTAVGVVLRERAPLVRNERRKGAERRRVDPDGWVVLEHRGAPGAVRLDDSAGHLVGDGGDGVEDILSISGKRVSLDVLDGRIPDAAPEVLIGRIAVCRD